MQIDANDWTAVIATAELPEGKPTRVEAFGIGVLVFRSEDSVFAVADRCTHQGAPLHRGIVKTTGSEPMVTCPAHGSVFSLTDGRVHRGPATQPLPAFEARIANDMVEVRPRA